MAFHTRKNIRLPGRDYTQGDYFVTLTANVRANIFGRVIGEGTDARMELNALGRIVDECWRRIPDHFAHARIEEMQVMPDHLHAIVAFSALGTATPRVARTGV